MDTRQIIDKLKDRIPFYGQLSGQFDNSAILGHAAAKFPATLTDLIVSEAVKSGEVDQEFLGGIFNFVKKAAGTVLKLGSNLINGVAQTHQVQIQPRQPAPTPAQIQAIAAAAPSKEEKKGLSTIAIIGMAVGAVVLALIVFLFASNK